MAVRAQHMDGIEKIGVYHNAEMRRIMTKYEFLGDLSRLLSDLSEEERGEALQYYEDYFADAGRDQEQAVIMELESPEKVAAKIRSAETGDVQYGESGAMKDAAYPEVVSHNGSAGDADGGNAGNGAASGWEGGNGPHDAQEGAGSGRVKAEDNSSQIIKWLLIFAVAIVAIPVVVPTAAGILITIAALIFALFVALFGTGIGLGIGGLVSICIGLYYCITANFADAILGIGAGLVLLPVGIMLCYLGGLLFMKAAPGVIQLCRKVWDGICHLGQKIFS